MAQITVTVNVLLGVGDTTIMLFNHLVSFEQYFPASTTPNPPWTPNVPNGDYLVAIAGACPPGGSITINITGIASSNRTMPIVENAAGHFIDSATITV